MGTGDCFVLKFYSGQSECFKIMIDCGTWSGDAAHCTPYITDLKTYVNNQIDVLVITHEHKDHVHGFDVCEDLFTQEFEIGEIWMAWTENEDDERVQAWQKQYGNQKKALGKAAKKLNEMVNSQPFAGQYANALNGPAILAARQQLSEDVIGYANLHLGLNPDGTYAGPLKGMNVVKQKLTAKFRYFKPGDLITNLNGLAGIRIFVLGPPENWEQVKKESGGNGESYDHNKMLNITDAFSMAILAEEEGKESSELLPFDSKYIKSKADLNTGILYGLPQDNWRQIGEDWLFGAGALALRINSITNNLSLALAFEFEETGKVMLFPGDAEYGSWASWHQIPWKNGAGATGKPFMEDLLNRTVFYKVAHHLSHNGTAKKLGMEMMTHPELVAMATLDYRTISSKWITTMPNQGLVQDLIKATSGRLLVMNSDGLFYDKKNKTNLASAIEAALEHLLNADREAFQDAVEYDKKNHLYVQYTLMNQGTA
jgi:hypothetical protein